MKPFDIYPQEPGPQAVFEAERIAGAAPAERAGEEERQAASLRYANDDIQIYEDARVSTTDEGVWVEAWVWLSVGPV